MIRWRSRERLGAEDYGTSGVDTITTRCLDGQQIWADSAREWNFRSSWSDGLEPSFPRACDLPYCLAPTSVLHWTQEQGLDYVLSLYLFFFWELQSSYISTKRALCSLPSLIAITTLYFVKIILKGTKLFFSRKVDQTREAKTPAGMLEMVGEAVSYWNQLWSQEENEKVEQRKRWFS